MGEVLRLLQAEDRDEDEEQVTSAFQEPFSEDQSEDCDEDEFKGTSVSLEAAEDNSRLDLFLAKELGVSRSYAKSLVIEGRVRTLRGEARLKPSSKVRAGASFAISLPPPRELELEPEPVAFGVVYEDDDIAVIDKPAGLVVAPAPGHWRGTLLHGLLYRFPSMRVINGTERPGIVHRLDAGTSGLMVVAKNLRAQSFLMESFSQRKVKKESIALVKGSLPHKEGSVDAPIGRDPRNRLRMAVVPHGKPAVTRYEVLWLRQGCSLTICRPVTGRTHQIRVHMSYLGCPIVGDILYSPKSDECLSRPFLHAWQLAFPHPTRGEVMSFRSFLPLDLRQFLRGRLSTP